MVLRRSEQWILRLLEMRRRVI